MTEYPWCSLEPVSRGALRLCGELRRHFLQPPTVEQLQHSLGELVGSDVRISLRTMKTGEPTRAQPCALALTLDGSVQVRLDLEPAFVAAVVGRTLGQGSGLDSLADSVDPALLGAMGALIAEASRRSGVSAARRCASDEPSGIALGLDATIVLDEAAYSARVWAWPVHVAGTRLPAEPLLDRWRDLLVVLPLVVGASLATPAELESLGVGDAWLPGQGFWLDHQGVGRALLVPPDADEGVWVDLAPDGRVVLLNEVGRLSVDPDSTGGAGDMPKTDDKLSSTLTSAVLDAPVVVRVEVGAISLTVRDWTALHPGDVLAVGRRVGEPVTLRIAGREVARGDLVSVEGEIGVRIRELIQEASH